MSAKSIEYCWLAFGLIGQGLFSARFLLQWIASEKEKRSVIPLGFWYLSTLGGITLLFYAIHKQDPVFILGQSTGVIIYLRNLYLIRHQKKIADAANKAPA